MLLSLCMVTFISNAQQVVVQNFETPASYNLNIFAGLAGSTQPDPVAGGTRGNTLNLVSSSTGEVYQGCELIQLVSKLKLTTDKTVKIDVYSTVAFTLLAKAENGGVGVPNSGASQSYTTPNAWQTLTFTFTQSLDNTGVANGSYSSLTLFPNWKADNTGFAAPTNFSLNVDNITSEATPVTPPQPPAQPATAAPTPPLRALADVISLFSDAYANIPVTEWSASYDDSNISDVSIAGNATKKIDFTNFLGVVLTNYNNATSMTHFHMDYWIPNTADLTGKVLNPKLSNHAAQNGETSALLLTNLPTVKGEWVSLDAQLSSFAPQGAGTAFAREAVKEFLLASNLGTVYVDNIYLHKNTTLATKTFALANINMYPNPANNVLNIDAKSSIENVSIYNLLGQEVMSETVNKQSTSLNIANLQSGVYVVKTAIDGNIASSKFVKQ